MGKRSSRRVVIVHAHPDDEALGTGGTIAQYAAAGAHVCLVTCTNGELGEIAEVPDLGTTDEIRPRLGEIRRRELEDACRELGGEAPPGEPGGAIDLRMLGYHDSGMDGTPSTRDPAAFVNQDLGEVTERVVEVLRDVEPQVVITYNEIGLYGHPDHIKAHEAALAAADAVGVPRVYYIAFPKSLMRGAAELARQAGEDGPSFADDEIERIGTPDELIAATIDCTRFVDHKFRALAAHRTQLGTTQMFLQIPDEFRVFLGYEHYVLGRSREPWDGTVASDLFDGSV